MIDSSWKRPRYQPIKCWGCEGDHMHKDFPHKGDSMRTMHNIQKVGTVDDVGRSMPRIYTTLENRQEDYQSHMIEVEDNINNHTISIFIDYRVIHSYINPNMVDIFKLDGYKHGKYWLVQLAIGMKEESMCLSRILQ